jgi:pyruvate dehydrogenase E1 component alpha subunit
MSATETIVAQFAVRLTRIIDARGVPIGDMPEWANDRAVLTALYRNMQLTRAFDAKAVALQRTGRLGTFASSLGQEAIGTGVAAAMRRDDVLVPSFREQSALIWRGISMTEQLMFWGGDERGSDYSISRADFPISIPVGSHAPHAAGVALAFKLRREPRVAVCMFGDGATSKGEVYEAMNVAGVWRLPVIYVVSNNQWAISVPVSRQTAAATLAQKSIAGGIAGEQVDGNDVVAVRHVTGAAIERARAGEGAQWIEAVTYRMTDHTTADDARRYRKDEEVSAHWREDPIARLRNLLVARHGWGKSDEEGLMAECAAQVESATAAYLATPPQAPGSIFDHLFAVLPETLERQRAALLSSTLSDGDHG